MTSISCSIRKLAFLTPGNYPDSDPHSGLEKTLQLFELGERLGYDGAWVRQRHLEPGISSAAAFLAAATQRTSRIELGTAVIPIGYESPYRLAEDLSTVDVLSRGRLNVGLSAGFPPHAEILGPLVFDSDWRSFDFSHERVLRFVNNLRGGPIGEPGAIIEFPGGRVRPRLQPHAPGLLERIWYGGGSLRSVEWTGRNGLNLLIGNVTSGEGTDNFFEAQLHQLETFFAQQSERRARVALGRVIVPFDRADASTRKRYADYAAGRHERTLKAHGERRTLFARDIVGTSEQILEQLASDPILDKVDELRLELPYEFEQHEYEQIITDFIETIAPALGWRRLGLTASAAETPLQLPTAVL
ncbi:LLM class flavin-dependent oxidoreductase [Mesorhizobium sp. WSM4307]|uniref:LLM class flavin-dependent oxidoreductase n=1 Tax=unclassified Mesorhizobium TaxID=325217 RepID=UPI000BB0988C|nr:MULTISPECIES: LLM class flavin-dependent oxidoreductase [unclassified Mesorhizobium]PBB24367.1 LLM class flavin-dependent oxidoreductase [Mesorhizobium sp. WSM4304]PBB74665.1 LLM class flavin-dependent oxidoreductase [Mesorhizobium sp. WSM4308]TRC71640.1 LLM class flavin-dependent oxidoreductase [Mesorhizobium sp. WSM4315]TRC83444.1 LLM class flavin-dependent oxidoreductase [Mesorhizobium sp. WSM4307]